MKRVITAAVLIPLVLLLLLKGSFLVLVAATALVAELATWEYLSIADCQGFRRTLVLVAIAVLFAATFFSPALILPALGLCSLRPDAGLQLCVRRSNAFYAIPPFPFSRSYTSVLTLATLPLLWVQPDGPSLLIFLFCIVWTGDVAALYVGRNFGRHKLAPQISPNKSWEGSAASVVGSLLIAALLVGLARWLESRRRSSSFPGTPGSVAGIGGPVECLCPGWRSGRVRDQAWRRSQGFGRHATRSWGYPRPHRCPAAGRAGAVVRSMDSTVFQSGLACVEAHLHPRFYRFHRDQHPFHH